MEGVGGKLEGVGYSEHALTCLVGCRLPPLDGYVAVRLVLTTEVYAATKYLKAYQQSITYFLLLG